jgi:hypothetical protein
MRIIALCGCLVFFVTGCLFGDPAAHRSVSLQLQVAAPSQTSLSASDPELQDALRIVDTVMASYGVSRNPNPPSPNESHFIAIYDVQSATGQLVVATGPTVHLFGDRLVFSFLEFPAYHSSAHVKQVCRSIADALKSYYGNQRVKIEH